MVEEFVPIISQVGFPIFISLWVLMRMEKTIKQNTEVIIKLNNFIQAKLK